MIELRNNQFRDNTGELWTLDITVSSYMAIKKELEIDITDVFSESSWIQQLATSEDVGTLITMGIIVLKTAMKESDLDIEGFCARIGGDEIEGLTMALIGGVVNFIPAPKRKPFAKAVEFMQSSAVDAGVAASEHLDEMQPLMEEVATSEMKKLKLQALSQVNALKNSSSELPE